MLPQLGCQYQPPNDSLQERLMAQGEITLRQDETVTVYLQRGSKVKSCDGIEVGILAALIIDGQRQNVNQLLLCQLPHSTEYRRIPLEFVSTISDEIVHLTIQSDDVQALTIY